MPLGASVTQSYAMADLSHNVALKLNSASSVFVSAGAGVPSLYMSFGLPGYPPNASAQTASGATGFTPFGFGGDAGYYTDAATGLVYVKARWYDPATGRWISKDPIRLRNRNPRTPYQYAINNPTVYTDYNGKSPTKNKGANAKPFFTMTNPKAIVQGSCSGGTASVQQTPLISISNEGAFVQQLTYSYYVEDCSGKRIPFPQPSVGNEPYQFTWYEGFNLDPNGQPQDNRAIVPPYSINNTNGIIVINSLSSFIEGYSVPLLDKNGVCQSEDIWGTTYDYEENISHGCISQVAPPGFSPQYEGSLTLRWNCCCKTSKYQGVYGSGSNNPI